MIEIRLAGEPCFGTGCHTFGLKIATAALRPRNDTNMEHFYLGNGRFCFMRRFHAVLFCNEIGTPSFEKRTILFYAAFLRGVALHRFLKRFVLRTVP